ncbi:hypothetical protein SeLEV6574_g03376 [Synchytrium endobioticum]|uniref:Uncharacterized protein n=1 Tax=Synchytrium endobioticum TaxID=286115 RepID=A0A507D4F4_9FUNG|nr:hypothetical protein SeLEV6574_g03376 [Synchytrium endobioticum]
MQTKAKLLQNTDISRYRIRQMGYKNPAVLLMVLLLGLLVDMSLQCKCYGKQVDPPHDLVQLPVATEYCCWEHGNHGGMWLPDEVCMIPNNHTVFAACCRNSIKTIFPVGYSIIDTEAQCGGSLHP